MKNIRPAKSKICHWQLQKKVFNLGKEIQDLEYKNSDMIQGLDCEFHTSMVTDIARFNSLMVRGEVG